MTSAPDHSRRMALRARIGLLTAVAVAIAITLTTVAVYLIARSELYNQFDADLMRRATAAAQTVNNPDALSFPPALLDDTTIGFLSADGEMIPLPGGTEPPTTQAATTVAQGGSARSISSATSGSESVRIAAESTGPEGALVLARPTATVDETLGDLATYLAVIGLFGVVAAGMLGYGVARTGLRPVAELTSATERVARTQELDPIDVTGDDEVARLAESFNTMLRSLDAARERERRLIADAGHELRTPLTSIRTNLDLLAQADDRGIDLPEHERKALLDDVRAQIIELTDLIGDLVQLSRDIPLAEALEDVDLRAVCLRAIERVQRRAPTLTFEQELGQWWVIGSAASLERAVTNILDNAAKWSPPDGIVTVRLANGELVVRDQGEGIPETEQTRVFERFYRSDSARGTPGSGLGLAIVAQTAERHGGTVTAGRTPAGGAELVLTLPGSVSSSDA